MGEGGEIFLQSLLSQSPATMLDPCKVTEEVDEVLLE